MQIRRMIDWPYVVGLLLLPLLVAGIILLIGWIQGLTRYDSMYFSEPYLNRYAVPSDLLINLETAIRNGDEDQLAELWGTRNVPQDVEPLPDVRFLIFLEEDGIYTDYLFMDMKNYHRYPQHLKIVNGRYVVVPESLYYYVDSGHWVSTFGPIAAIWWIALVLFTLGVWVYRSMAATRKKMFQDRVPR